MIQDVLIKAMISIFCESMYLSYFRFQSNVWQDEGVILLLKSRAVKKMRVSIFYLSWKNRFQGVFQEHISFFCLFSLVPLTGRNFKSAKENNSAMQSLFMKQKLKKWSILLLGKQKCESFVPSISFDLYIQTHPSWKVKVTENWLSRLMD